jgi:acylphosphatase
MIVGKCVSYRGQVQGVGFRFTTIEVARSFAVSGTVRNCSNGSVELFVQGEVPAVEAFLTALGRRMEGYIDEQTVEDAAPTDVSGFHIVR